MIPMRNTLKTLITTIRQQINTQMNILKEGEDNYGNRKVSFCSLEQNQLQRAYREEEWTHISIVGMGMAEG